MMRPRTTPADTPASVEEPHVGDFGYDPDDPASHNMAIVLDKIDTLLVEVHDSPNDRVRSAAVQAAAVWAQTTAALRRTT